MTWNLIRRKSQYSQAYYEKIYLDSSNSARAVLRHLFNRYPVQSMIDIGCGIGLWLKCAGDLGTGSLKGFDGPWVDREQLTISPENFSSINFESQTWPDFGKADLAISVEVAEHLSVQAGDRLVARLCECAPVVLFSAAIPQQGGVGHQNEQWQSAWAEKFAMYGYKPSLFLRRLTWTNSEVSFWYRQNMVVYFDPLRVPQLNEADDLMEPMDVVHPDLYHIRAIKRLRRGRLRRIMDAILMK